MSDPIITVTLSDVLTHGSIRAAIVECCPDTVMVADSSAMSGQTFATSGPGTGWTREFGAYDYAVAAIRQDMAASGGKPSECSAIDPEDGRVATGVDDFDEDGTWSGDIDWSDDSCVRLEVPGLEEAIEHPRELAMMVRAALEVHSECSDCRAWRNLVAQIRSAAEAAEALKDIDD